MYVCPYTFHVHMLCDTRRELNGLAMPAGQGQSEARSTVQCGWVLPPRAVLLDWWLARYNANLTQSTLYNCLSQIYTRLLVILYKQLCFNTNMNLNIQPFLGANQVIQVEYKTNKTNKTSCLEGYKYKTRIKAPEHRAVKSGHRSVLLL